tara:strand:+ start:155 stop:487 length:333 start_codon:yes stop_codon:yes gene_type:complete
MKPTYEQLEDAYKEVQASHDYWIVNYNQKADTIDKFCEKNAERINEITHKLNHKAAFMSHEHHAELCTERRILEDSLRHFIGFVDTEYVLGRNNPLKLKLMRAHEGEDNE